MTSNFVIHRAKTIFLFLLCGALARAEEVYILPVSITSELPVAGVPMDPQIDFSQLIEQNHLTGCLDHNSLEVVNRADGKSVPFSLEPGLTYGQKGRIQWVVENPEHKEFEIRFQAAPKENWAEPKSYTPMVGVGDLLRYNAGVPRPVAMTYPGALFDVTGDGRADLIGTWDYPRFTRGLGFTEPGKGPVVYPRIGEDAFLFGEAISWHGPLLPKISTTSSNDKVDFDVDSDGRVDLVKLIPREGTSMYPFGNIVVWQKRLEGEGEQYAEPQPLSEFEDRLIVQIYAAEDGATRGLLVETGYWQEVSFYRSTPDRAEGYYFQKVGTASSLSAIVALGGDQSWPFLCDWDDDGDWDLLVGGGMDSVRILINEGTNERAALREAMPVLSEGQPIRVWMSLIFPAAEDYKHNLCYSYPKFADWDGDGLKDLMLPTITNRIFWYKNIGVKGSPRFGPRLQIVPDGYEETPEKIEAAGRYLMEHWEGEPQEGQPFWWRTGAGFADWNGDGLMDMITLDGFTRELKLFTQQKDAQGPLHLNPGQELKLRDGRVIHEKIVGRSKPWTESFQCVDWDGDGLTDIVYSLAGGHGKMQEGGSMYLLRNVGTKTEPVFENPRTMKCFGESIMITKHGPHPAAGDMNGDGKPDLLTCHEDSLYSFFCHAAMEMTQRPAYELGELQRRPFPSASQETPSRQARIVVNDDSDTSFLLAHKPYREDQFYPLIDTLQNTQVDVYIYCLNRGGDTYAHRTRIAEMLGQDKEVQELGLGFKEMIDKQRDLQRVGIDPLAVLAARAREKGIQLWAGFRMNDIHEDWDEYSVLRSNFKMQHPELLLGSPYPEPHILGNTKADYSWAWNYARPEVRQRFLAVLEEACLEYDIDGVELDFLRGPYYFKTGERETNRPLMTDLLRQARAMVDRIALEKKRSIALAVRVDRTFELCEQKGLDVRKWLQEGIPDYLTPMYPGRMEINPYLHEFVEAAKGKHCRILGGIEGQGYAYGYVPEYDYYPWTQPSLSMFRAAAQSYYDQGAEGVYLFNYLAYILQKGSGHLWTQDKIQALHEIGDPRITKFLPKHYFIPVDQIVQMRQDPSLPPQPSPFLSLPAAPMENIGDTRTFRFWCGDDLEKARKSDRNPTVYFRLILDGYFMPQDHIQVLLNDQIVEKYPNPWRNQGFVFINPPVKKGLNTFTLTLDQRAANPWRPITIKTIDLLIQYK